MNLLSQTEITTILLNATIVVQIILIILFCMSLWSWSIILGKFFSIKRKEKKIAADIILFEAGSTFTESLQIATRQNKSPISQITLFALQELRVLEKSRIDKDKKKKLALKNLKRSFQVAISKEVKKMSHSLSFLATCANSSPFIGLLGTVWGIMHAFQTIGVMKTTALTAVAPGIAEALIATAIGLGVAIPASIAYNYFLSRIVRIETDLINFASTFLNRAEIKFSQTTIRDIEREKAKERIKEREELKAKANAKEAKAEENKAAKTKENSENISDVKEKMAFSSGSENIIEDEKD